MFTSCGRSSSILLGIVAASLFGGVIELLQGALTTTRQAEFADFFADIVGAFTAGSIYYVARHPLKKHVASLLFAILLLPAVAFASESGDVSFSGEIGAGLRRLGNESAALAKTPFQIENGNYLITLGVVGAVGLTYIFDRDIRARVQANRGATLDKAADAGNLAGDPFIHLGLSALVYGGGMAAGSQRWKETGEMMGEALILADASTFLIKEATGRGRPNATTAKGDFRPFGFRRDYDSFPSMHAASSFALASVLAATSESIAMKTLYYSAATFVGFARLHTNKHWASDVVLGAALGELCGRVVTGYHASGAKLALAPQAYENGAGLALVGRW
ncbi:MAG: phosphatase PAP2 family protein [Deltaproteobacteria bacterium]|nr:phosphatase PAP2 family protein [Deltaproteobacteria bacterium]